MSNESYQMDIVQAAEQLFQTNNFAAFQEDMISIVEYNIEQGFMEGADEVLPPEPEPPIIETFNQATATPDKKLPESARIALLTLIALNMGYISSLGVFVLNKRGSYDSTVIGLRDAERYFKQNNIPYAIYNLQYAQTAAKGIGGTVVQAVTNIIRDIQGGATSISFGIQKATEEAQQVIARNIIGRAGTWGNGYLGSRNLGMLLSAPDETRLKWNLGEREHCQSCLKLNGKVKTADYWREAGVGPQSGPYGSLPNTMLDCKGYKCGCFYTVTNDPLTPGDLPRLP